MEQLNDYADDRLINGCIYCGGLEETRDHVPSRVLLEPPFPENLPVVMACLSCNQSFSRDEEYFACLIESVIAGSADPAKIRKSGVANILRRAPALRSRLEAARSIDGEQVRFRVEDDRIRNIVLKLARGHAAYELSQPCREEPSYLWWSPLCLMTEEQRDSYEASQVLDLYSEIGSRQMQRMIVAQFNFKASDGTENGKGLLVNDWLDVQEGNYRYLATDEVDGVRVKIVIAEYLACEAGWSR